jgi:hypothetical protein
MKTINIIMKTINKISILLLFMAVTMVYSGCSKADRDNDTDLSSSNDNATAEVTFAAMANTIGEVVDSLPQVRLASCVEYTLVPTDSVTFPKTLTINYGTLNCASADGSMRRGTIVATLSGKYRDSMTTINITTQNFYYNSYLIQSGSFIITNKGRNAARNINFTMDVTNANITTTEGNITWSCVRNREWIAGAGTTTSPYDDVYSITGTANGRGVDGNTFTVTITSPLIAALNCQYIEKGILILVPANLNNRLVNFGNGTCDNQATVTLNEKTYTITIN